MIPYPPAEYAWPKPWQPLVAEAPCLEFGRMMGEVFGGYDAAPTLAAELQRECCPEHPLHGKWCVAVGRASDDPNEFVFVTDNPELPIAFVHLTWTVERLPTFPYTVGYRSWEEFQAAWVANKG